MSAAVGLSFDPAQALLVAPLVAAGGMLPSLSGLSPSYAVLGWSVARLEGEGGQVAAVIALALAVQLAAAGVGGLSLGYAGGVDLARPA